MSNRLEATQVSSEREDIRVLQLELKDVQAALNALVLQVANLNVALMLLKKEV